MLDVTPRRIRQLADEGTVIKAGPGEYELHASVLGYVRRTVSGDEGYEADRARKMAADADLAEIQAARAAGAVVEAKGALRCWQESIEVAVAKLANVGPTVAPLVILEKTPKAAGEIVTKAIRAACEELYESGPAAPSEEPAA